MPVTAPRLGFPVGVGAPRASGSPGPGMGGAVGDGCPRRAPHGRTPQPGAPRRARGGALPRGELRGEAAPRSAGSIAVAMRTACILLTALAALAAYYVYLPLPSTLSDPWKLMLLDATFRATQQTCHLIDYLKLSHHLIALNFLICTFDKVDFSSHKDIKITDAVFDGVEVRVYQPLAKQDGGLKRSIVYIHGGGWALARAKMGAYNHLCRIMAESLNAVVVSVEYRLVPEVCFPEQWYDALRATKHFLQPDVLAEYSVDPSRIAISGDSAGGNLAAAVCQQLSKDEHLTIRPKLQALVYPVLQAFDFSTPSYQQNMNIPILRRTVMIEYWTYYLNANSDLAASLLINNHTALNVGQAASFRERLNWTSLLPSSFKKNYKPLIQTTGKAEIVQEVPALLDVRAAPLLAEDEALQLQPKTYILVCENDVLRDDGTMYAKRLERAGVEVTLDYFEDCFHGCMIFTSWPADFSAGVQTRDSYIKWLDENL